MHLFEDYLKAHNLEGLTVSIIAKVRYMTVYNAMKGFPISLEHARQIRQAVLNYDECSLYGAICFDGTNRRYSNYSYQENPSPPFSLERLYL